jgi:MATE family multidrug resistance protein
LGYLLGLTDALGNASGAEGFWISLVVGLVISGVLMTTRLIRVSHP